MAIAVIGGLLVSTVLSLVFIPSVYTLMDDLSHLVGRVFGWMLSPNASDEHGVAGAAHGVAAPATAEASAKPEKEVDKDTTWKRVTEFPSGEGPDRPSPAGMQQAAE
jgi:hypothetical protein